jgi:hypothetical protein
LVNIQNWTTKNNKWSRGHPTKGSCAGGRQSRNLLSISFIQGSYSLYNIFHKEFLIKLKLDDIALTELTMKSSHIWMSKLSQAEFNYHEIKIRL